MGRTRSGRARCLSLCLATALGCAGQGEGLGLLPQDAQADASAQEAPGAAQDASGEAITADAGPDARADVLEGPAPAACDPGMTYKPCPAVGAKCQACEHGNGLWTCTCKAEGWICQNSGETCKSDGGPG